MTKAQAGRLGGLKNKGENNPNAKLTREQVRNIRRAMRSGASRKGIAKLFGITARHVSQLTSGRRWA